MHEFIVRVSDDTIVMRNPREQSTITLPRDTEQSQTVQIMLRFLKLDKEADNA